MTKRLSKVVLQAVTIAAASFSCQAAYMVSAICHIEVFANPNSNNVTAQGFTEATVIEASGPAVLQIRCDLYKMSQFAECNPGQGTFANGCYTQVGVGPNDVGKKYKCFTAEIGNCNQLYYTRGDGTLKPGGSLLSYRETCWSGGCDSDTCGRVFSFYSPLGDSGLVSDSLAEDVPKDACHSLR